MYTPPIPVANIRNKTLMTSQDSLPFLKYWNKSTAQKIISSFPALVKVSQRKKGLNSNPSSWLWYHLLRVWELLACGIRTNPSDV